ncbi:helix-turn-helix domain-containing protein [Streptomyces sp. CA-106131]|uniref:helix-turn-helix domain-containing protein n=1 Tax=Streptomyces sp. CA-106131 TaxID=3240045 RepID=UPI003D91F30F
MELLRLSKAAKRLGVHPVTLRLWADSGKIPVTWVGRERRFSSIDVEAMKVSTGGEGVRLEGLYVRVSGSHGGGILASGAGEGAAGHLDGRDRQGLP